MQFQCKLSQALLRIENRRMGTRCPFSESCLANGDTLPIFRARSGERRSLGEHARAQRLGSRRRRAWGAPLRRCVVALVGRPGATSPEEIIGIHDSIGTSNFGSIPSGGFLIAGICDPILRMTRKSSHWGRQWVCHLAPKSPMRVAPRHKHKGRERSWAAGGASGDGGAARAARCEQKKGMAGSWISVAHTQSQRARAPRCHRQTSPGRPSPWCFRVVVYP